MFALILNTRIQIPISLWPFTNISVQFKLSRICKSRDAKYIYQYDIYLEKLTLARISISIIDACFVSVYILRLRFISIGKIKACWTAFFFKFRAK